MADPPDVFDISAWLMAEPGRAVAHAAWLLRYRWNAFEACFVDPEVQLVLRHTRSNRRALVSLAQGASQAHSTLLRWRGFDHHRGPTAALAPGLLLCRHPRAFGENTWI
jgi:hypothetical protein